MNFNQFALSERITKAAADAGYTQPTPIQERAIPKILKGADVIGIAQTGTGKTAAFSLPILSMLSELSGQSEERHLKMLIIAPTRELADQIHANIRVFCKYTNLRSGAVFGGVSDKGQINKLNSGADIIIATPGRLIDLIKAGHGQFSKLKHLVIDEADRMLDMGFIPDIRSIVKKLPKSRQTLLFSATFTPQVEHLVKEFLHSPTVVEVGNRSDPAKTVTQVIYKVEPHQKQSHLIELIESSHEFFSVIVFARTRAGAEELGKALKKAKLDCEYIHGERSQGQRRRAIDDFKSNKLQILVATDVAARGIDIQDVSHVINYDFPENNEDYIHRIGRTGRANQSGDAITFVSSRDLLSLQRLEKFIQRTLPTKRLAGFNYAAPPSEPTSTTRKAGSRSNSNSPSRSPRHYRAKEKTYTARKKPSQRSQSRSRQNGSRKPKG